MPLATFAALLDRLSNVTTDGNGPGYLASCPAHDDSHPSLVVTYNETDRKVALYDRGGCSRTDVLKALRLTDFDLFELDKGDPTLNAEGTVKQDRPSTAQVAAMAAYTDRARQHLTDEAREYVARRFGLTDADIDALGIGYDDGSIDGGTVGLSRKYYHNTPRVTVPFRSVAGAVHYVQARALTTDGDPRWSGPNNPQGVTLGKYGVFKRADAAGTIITEGPGDALAGYAAGYATVGIRGAGLAANKTVIAEIATALTAPVYIAGDNDNAGDNFAKTLTATLTGMGVTVQRVNIPKDFNDLAAWVEADGPDTVGSVIAIQEDTVKGGPMPTIPLHLVQSALADILTDGAKARLILETAYAAGYGIRHSTGAGWHIYDPRTGVWSEGEDDYSVRGIITDMAADLTGEYLDRIREIRDDADAHAATSDEGKAFAAHAHKVYTAHVNGAAAGAFMDTVSLDRIVKALRGIPEVRIKTTAFDRTASRIVVANGVVDLNTGELLPFDRDMLATKRLATAYRPGARCPRWETFMNEIFASLPDNEDGPHSGMPAYMRRVLGYGLHGTGEEQIMAALVGSGANGKSVLIDVLTNLTEQVTNVAPFELFERKHGGGGVGPSPELLAMRGARYVVASEGSQGAMMDDALVKRVSGGDRVTARALHREPVTFDAKALVLLASNYRPRFSGQDYGVWRRVKIVPFNETFSGARRDNHLVTKLLRKEGWRQHVKPGEDYGDGPEGILAWLVAGALEYRQTSLSEPSVVSAATETHREASDPLRDFVTMALVEDPHGDMDSSDVYATYREWAAGEGIPEREWPRRSSLMQSLEARGYHLVSSGRSVRVRGLRPLTKPEKFAAL